MLNFWGIFYFRKYLQILMRLAHLTKSIWPKISWNLTKKISHWWTLTLEHDQNFSPKNINLRTWPKYGWIWPKIENKINIATTTNIYVWIWLKWYIFGHVQKLKLVVVNFSVMFTDFGHLDLIKWINLILKWHLSFLQVVILLFDKINSCF